MAKKIVVSDSLIQKPPPLAELDEEYRAELKEWMGEWFLYPIAKPRQRYCSINVTNQ